MRPAAELGFRTLCAGQLAPQGGAIAARLGNSGLPAFPSRVPPKSESRGAYSSESGGRISQRQREKELKRERGMITILITIVGSRCQAPAPSPKSHASARHTRARTHSRALHGTPSTSQEWVRNARDLTHFPSD